jgi:biotin carboxyl carrier protein
MPGQVLSISAATGAVVEAGETVITLEAMKMEHAVVAPQDGTVTDLFVRVGEQVTRGQRLAVVEAG